MNVSDKKLKDFVGDLGDMHIGTLANISSVAALAAELVNLGNEAISASIGFQKFTNQTGLSWVELQKWQIVGEQANVSAETIAGSLTALQKNLAEIRLGRGNIAPFQMLGIGVNGSAFDVLDQLRSKIKGLDAATATNLMEQMGINGDMINVLKLSNEEFAKLSHTVGGLTKDQEQQFLRTKQAVVQLGQVFKYAGFDIVSHFLGAFEKLVPLLNQAHFGFLRLRDVLIALAIYFFPVQAAIIGLLLLLDDLAVYFTGGKSLTGKGIEGLKHFAQEMKDAFNIPNLEKLTALLAGRGSFGLGGIVAAGVGGAKMLANTFNINVTGAGSAVDIANEVTRQITRHFSNSEQELNNQGH